ncbi:MAG: hypothetical protein K9M56_01955 [Victivallales bacterium]|nr:hypothetical protein [Victivallales bacterium]
MKLKTVLILLFFFSIQTVIFSRVTVIKRATEVNPKIYFAGITGERTLGSHIKTSLKKSGWFRCRKNKQNCKYIISGYKSSGEIIIEVKDNIIGNNYRFALNEKKNKKKQSYIITDAILKKLFGIPGICNSKIAFNVQIGKNKDIYICNFDGSAIKRITNNRTLSLDPSWGLNNNLITYTLYKSTYTDIVGKYLKTGKTYNLASFPGLNNGGTVSPDGKYIALILSRDRQVELYIKELRGSKTLRITKDSAVEGTPCWSPKSDLICYVSDKGIGRPLLYVYDLKSGKRMKLPTVGSEAVSPDWSPVGNKIVYSARFGKQYTLAVYDVRREKSEAVNINAAGDWMSPSWAPDGRHVICSRRLNYKSQLYIVDTWTGKAKQLLKYKSNLTSPSWSELF